MVEVTKQRVNTSAHTSIAQRVALSSRVSASCAASGQAAVAAALEAGYLLLPGDPLNNAILRHQE